MNVCGYIHCYALNIFVIFDWYHSLCLSWDPPNEDDLGRNALLGKGATPTVSPALQCDSSGCIILALFERFYDRRRPLSYGGSDDT